MSSGFNNKTNQTRVTKIVELVALLQKSAHSNSSSREEVWELMKPAIKTLSDLLRATAEMPSCGHNDLVEKPSLPTLSTGQRAALMLADQSSMRELVVSLIARLETYEERLGKNDKPKEET